MWSFFPPMELHVMIANWKILKKNKQKIWTQERYGKDFENDVFPPPNPAISRSPDSSTPKLHYLQEAFFVLHTLAKDLEDYSVDPDNCQKSLTVCIHSSFFLSHIDNSSFQFCLFSTKLLLSLLYFASYGSSFLFFGGKGSRYWNSCHHISHKNGFSRIVRNRNAKM